MAVRLCAGCTDRYLLLQYLHFRHPWRSYAAVPWMAKSGAYPWMGGIVQEARDGGALMYRMYGIAQ
jgi:hypothetical protein